MQNFFDRFISDLIGPIRTGDQSTQEQLKGIFAYNMWVNTPVPVREQVAVPNI